MQKFWVQAAMMIAGVIRGALGGAFGYLNTLIKSGFNSVMQFHQEGIAFARDMGLNAKEAQAYTEVLTERTERLAMKYGVAAEQVKELQRNISVATSRQLMLNEAQAEQFLQLNKLVGSSTVSKFTEEIMVGMGGQLDYVSGAVSKAYATAAKSGLNAQKVSEKIASNLSMANRLSFRNGVDGLTRMAIQAEKMGMNLQSVEAAASKFLELDQAIQNAAQMQMLGGSAAANFGNPLTAAYEANYDPEAFAERMQKSLASYATFDANKGVASVNGMNMDFVRNIAKAMGISADEATKMAKKNAEVRFKESNISSRAMAGLTQEQRDFLINKSNVANGRTTYTANVNGKSETYDLTKGDAIPKEVLAELMKYEGMSDHDIMAQNAESLSSINEILNGIKESIGAMFAKFIEGLLPELQGDIKNFGKWTKDKLEPAAKNVGVAARGIYDWFKKNGETIKSVASSLFGFLKFATEYWKLTLVALGSLKFLKFLGNAGIVGNGTSAASGAATGISNFASKMHQGSAHDIFRNVYKSTGRLKNQNWWTQTKAGARSAWKNTSNFAKGTAALGVATGVIQGIGAISEYNRRKEEINNSNMSQAEKDKALEGIRTDRNSEVGGAVGAGVGTLLGTFFFGPLGGMIGGAVGEFAGKFIGQYWDPIVNTVTSLFKKIGDGFVWLGGKLWDGIKWIMDNNPISIMAKGIGKIFGKDWTPTKLLFGDSEKHAEGGIVGGNSTSGDKVLTRLNSGEMVLNMSQQTKLFNAINSLKKPSINNSTSNIANSRHIIQTREVSIHNIGGNSSLVNNSTSTISAIKSLLTTSIGGNSSLVNNSISTIKRLLTTSIGGNSSLTNNSTSIGGNSSLANNSTSIGGNSSLVNNSISTIKSLLTTSIGGTLINKISNLASSTNNRKLGNYSFNRISNLVKGVSPKPTKIEAKPIGEKEYVYTPKRNETYNVNGNSITVKDFNINLSGTLKLDGGNNSKNVDVNALLNNHQFVSTLKELIQDKINREMNNGRYMNDLAVRRNHISSSSIIG